MGRVPLALTEQSESHPGAAGWDTGPVTRDFIEGHALMLVAFILLLVFLAGDIAICDVGDGCGPGFPDLLFYGAGIGSLLCFVMGIVRLRGRSKHQ